MEKNAVESSPEPTVNKKSYNKQWVSTTPITFLKVVNNREILFSGHYSHNETKHAPPSTL